MDSLQFWATFIGWMLTLAGWIITNRAQRKNLLHQVDNSARIDLTKGIRDYQNWLSRVDAMVCLLSAKIRMANVNWDNIYADTISLLSNEDAHRWIFLLEEYEILFPGTRDVRQELVKRHRVAFDKAWRLSDKLVIAESRTTAIQETQSLSNDIMNMVALMEDMRVYLQNKTLNSITGNLVPYRQPPDQTMPRIIVAHKDHLEIVPRIEVAAT
jgi:hypothetical protein